MSDTAQAVPAKPSWLRWPPNCCEACTGWIPDATIKWIGRCNQGGSLNAGEQTDSRFRCQDYVRRAGI